MDFNKVVENLRVMGACKEGIDLALSCGSVAKVAKKCDDPEWLLWLACAAGLLTKDKIEQLLTSAKASSYCCDVARTKPMNACCHAVHLMPKADRLPTVRKLFFPDIP